MAQRGKSILSYNINTTAKTKGAFAYPVYTVAAVIFPKTDGIILYHIMAIVFGIGLAFGIYFLSYLLTNNAYYALCVLVLTSLGGGLGYIFSSSADLLIPGVTSFSNFQKPHEAFAALLYYSSLLFFYLAVVKRNKHYWLFSLISLIILIPIYPYRLLSFFLITGVFVLVTASFTKKNYPFNYLGTYLGVVLPLALIYLLHFVSSGYGTLAGYKPATIPLISLVSGYGIFLAFYVYQLRYLTNKNNLLWIFLNIWIIVSFGLSILPFGMSRLYLSGLLFPIALLFVFSLRILSRRLQMPVILISLIFFIFSLPTSLSIFSRRIAEVKNNNIWYYIPEPIKQGLDYLESSKIDGVLALPPLSNLIPAYSVKHVYFGIKDQSPDYDNKIYKALLFYSNKLPEKEAKAFLQDNHINLVIVSNQEKVYGLPSYSFLKQVYKNQSLEILGFTQ